MDSYIPNYRFIGFDGFGQSLRAARVVLLRGDFGTGKTLFAVALGYHLLRHLWVNVASFNFPVSFGHAPRNYRCYAVVDEGGRLFDNRISFKVKELNELSGDLTYGLRKSGSYLLMPSYLDVDKRFRRGLRIHRRFPSGDNKSPGFFSRNVWLYHWERGEEEVTLQQPGINYWRGYLIFINPTSFFGTYDTYYKPTLDMLRDYVTRVSSDFYLLGQNDERIS